MLLYIHFPFCRSKCAYCDFTSYAGCSEALVFSYLTALKREIEFAGRRFENAAVDTVYLGGGTPSLLSPRQIEGLFGKIRKSFAHYSPSEVSAEVNPESATDDVLAAFADAGVNRISMGVQSFSDDNLRSVGRIHTADTARRAAERIARRFDNFSLDFMLGLPYDTEELVRAELTEAACLAP
ncbi:MAG TPA: radical SAM protein, partial [Candidatus Limadaptatus stercoravium]|nr:radical SAM protein [Candidatus Limadaptatus stercoravium]